MISRLNTICFTICIVCIVAGVLLALVIIWGDIAKELAWKGVLTLSVFFLAAALTLSVNKMIDRKP